MGHIIDENTDVEAIGGDNSFGLIPRDYDKIPLGAMPYTTPFSSVVPILSESELETRLRSMQGRFIRSIYTGTPEEDFQNGLNFCWSFSLSQAMKGSRDVDGQPKVDLLSEALGYDVGWRNAGNYCGSAIAACAKTGMCDRSFSPKRYNLNPSSWKQGWEEEAKNHRVLEWLELGKVDMRRETLTALSLGLGPYVGLNRFRHAMCFQEVQFIDGKIAIWTPNTHGPGQDWTLKGNTWIPDEAYVVRTTTWSKT